MQGIADPIAPRPIQLQFIDLREPFDESHDLHLLAPPDSYELTPDFSESGINVTYCFGSRVYPTVGM